MHSVVESYNVQKIKVKVFNIYYSTQRFHSMGLKQRCLTSQSCPSC